MSEYITPVMFTDSTGYSINYSVNHYSIVFDFTFSRQNTPNRLLSSSLNINSEIDYEDYIRDFWKFSPERATLSLILAAGLVGSITGYCRMTAASLTAFMTGLAISVAVVIGVGIVIYVIFTVIVNVTEGDNYYK